MILELEELTFVAIGPFVEEQTIPFTKLGKLVQIDGHRSDTVSSSGAGKSTVMRALEYLLGLNNIPSSALQSRLTKEGILVSGKFRQDGIPIVITRGKGKLSISIGGEVTTGSKLVEEKIDVVLGMPRDLFRKILHKRQKEGGFFLQFTPAKTFEFLTDALGLQAYRTKLALIDVKTKDLVSKRDSVQAQIDRILGSTTANNNAFQALGLEPTTDLTGELVLSLKGISEEADAKLQSAKALHRADADALESTRPQTFNTAWNRSTQIDLQNKVNEINGAIETLRMEETVRLTKATREFGDLKATKVQLEQKIQAGITAKTEAVAMASELKKIRDGMCPTCKSTWQTEAAKEKESELVSRMLGLKAKIESGTTAEGVIGSVAEEISKLMPNMASRPIPEVDVLRCEVATINGMINADRQQESQHLTAENARKRELLAEFSALQLNLKQKSDLELGDLSNLVFSAQDRYQEAFYKLKAHVEASTRYKSQLVMLTGQKLKIEEDSVTLSAQITTLNADVEVAEEAKKLVKSFLSCSFDDALEAIGNTATEIVRHIPNMANATIQLDGTRETDDGKVKDEVTAVINMKGYENIDIRTLSGGEGSAADLAVDLAVIDMLETKSGKGINVLLLDEPFNGLGSVEIEMALEILKNSNSNKRLIIVDHNPVIAEFMSDKILVNSDGQTSQILLN